MNLTKKSKLLLLNTLVFGILWGTSSHAQNEPTVTMGVPFYQGSGCPEGTAAITLSPDSKVLSVLFDAFMIEIGGEFGVERDVLECDLSVPLHIPAGYQVSLVKVDYRGFAFIPRLGKMRVRSRYSFYYPGTGRRTRPFTRQRTRLGPIDEEFIVSVRMNERLLWSACGEDMDMNLNAQLEGQTNRWNEEGLLTLDSLDATVDSKTEYYLNWRKCIDQPRRPRREPPHRPSGRRGSRYCPSRNCN